jgi:predicted TIM-barrel fold metal-dependent hydrolase
MCTYEAVGADHMVLGSDYPHVIGDISRSVSSISELNISLEDKEKIFGENGKKILKL